MKLSDIAREKRDMRVFRSMITQDPRAVGLAGKITIEFASLIISKPQDGIFTEACIIANANGPEPEKLSARMGAAGIIQDNLSKIGMEAIDIDIASDNLMSVTNMEVGECPN